jgi:hypothetical protein
MNVQLVLGLMRQESKEAAVQLNLIEQLHCHAKLVCNAAKCNRKSHFQNYKMDFLD